ncbi:hypothetical protein [Flavobacterium sp.]|jgi:hypothetical protein|uniref:hypothetical protein n=1 Tax=Flavobacterium sp. TaxID=239 RepID=UPI0037BF5299
MTSAELATMLKANLADNRMYSIQLFVQDLIARTRHPDGIDQYRITNLTTGLKITSLAEFIAAIDSATISARFPYTNSEGMQSDRVTGFNVVPTNLEVELSPYAASDTFYSQFHDFSDPSKNKFAFMFHAGYMNDGDTVLPLKTFYVRLYRK